VIFDCRATRSHGTQSTPSTSNTKSEETLDNARRNPTSDSTCTSSVLPTTKPAAARLCNLGIEFCAVALLTPGLNATRLCQVAKEMSNMVAIVVRVACVCA